MPEAITAEATSLQLTRTYPHSCEKVFNAWTDPRALQAWFGPSDEFKVPHAEIDLRVGGSYRIVMSRPDGTELSVGGVYREVSPHRKLVFTWAWENTPEQESLVTVELHEKAQVTELVLTHERFVDEEARNNHLRGWTGGLERLGRLVLN